MRKILLGSALLASLGYAASAQSITNSGFETWHDYEVSIDGFGTDSLALEAPDAWAGIDSLIAALTPFAVFAGIEITPGQQVFQTENAHSGTYAVELRSINVGEDLGVLPGVLLNSGVAVDPLSLQDADLGDILNLISYTGGTTVNAKVDTVKAWVLLDDTNEDNALINVTLLKTVSDSAVEVGGGTYVITPGVNEYTEVAVPVTYTSDEVPDRLIVAFVSSNIQEDTAHEGNTLYVDDVTFSYTDGGVSIQQPLLHENQILVYPNPADEQMYFNLSPNAKPEEFMLTIVDVTGKEILREQLKNQVNVKNVSAWAKGTYLYTLTHTKTGTAEQGKFVLK